VGKSFKGQHWFTSLVEAKLNTASGFVISWLTWTYFVVPLYHIQTTHFQNLQVVAIFTVISILRSYLWRRIFNHYHVKGVRNERECEGTDYI
jgi:membrane protein implicated in regulation of membrane protease activity